MPERIQRSRKKGSKLPPNTVCVTRPGIFGNPFTPKNYRAAGYKGTDEHIAKRCVETFRVWLGKHWREVWDGEESERARNTLLLVLPKLRGKNLACWCPVGSPCHGDVLLKLANAEQK